MPGTCELNGAEAPNRGTGAHAAHPAAGNARHGFEWRFNASGATPSAG